MTKQEFETVKTIIYACTHPVWSNGQRVAYAETDRVISALEKIYAFELGVELEKPLWRIWKEQDESERCKEQQEAASETPKEKSAASFLQKIIKGCK